jgi:hypothetical protein
VADLEFQVYTLGSGTFQLTSDGKAGILVTRS